MKNKVIQNHQNRMYGEAWFAVSYLDNKESFLNDAEQFLFDMIKLDKIGVS